jgi:hypothetical protein
VYETDQFCLVDVNVRMCISTAYLPSWHVEVSLLILFSVSKIRLVGDGNEVPRIRFKNPFTYVFYFMNSVFWKCSNAGSNSCSLS